MEYKVIRVDSGDYEDPLSQLSRQVSTLMLDGWKCQGGISVRQSVGFTVVYQALVKCDEGE